MRVDVHSHVIPRRVVDALVERPSAFGARVESDGGRRRVVHDQGYVYPLFPEFHDPEAKVESMDRKGIDVSVISPAPPMFYYWADAELALEVARLVNDGIAEMVAASPSRLRGMGTLPVQHPDVAVAELERVTRRHGFRAVEVGTSIEGAQLADRRFRPLLRRAQELGVFLFAHPYYVGARPGLESYYLTNLIGNPLDTTIMVANLMLSGALDELPDLRICLAHGGGFVPYQVGRLAHGHGVRPEARAETRTSPRDLLRRFHFDSLLFEPAAIRYLIDLVGADRVCIGTDSPFDMGDTDPEGTIGAIPRLTASEREQLCSGTALRLLGEAARAASEARRPRLGPAASRWWSGSVSERRGERPPVVGGPQGPPRSGGAAWPRRSGSRPRAVEGEAMSKAVDDNAIERITADRGPHYEPYGWHHWPEHPWLTYQFRRGLGETQEGGGTVSECFQAASRMIPGDKESWHREWLRVGDRNLERGDREEAAGHVRTAMNCWLRAADYFRQAEFYLKPDDPRRLATFDQCEASTHRFLKYLSPPGEVVEIPYEGGKTLYGYFVRAPFPGDKLPVLICFGGLDSFKDEMWFMQAHGALQRGISVLMLDGPGQGGTLRRHKLPTRPDYEVPIGRCIDWLSRRPDVDPTRIAACGSSLGGYYAARAGCYEHRLAAVISHGAIWSIHDMWGDKGEDFGLAMHIKWVFGTPTMKDAMERAKAFTLEGHLKRMRCPYLIVHGGHDVLTVSQARKAYDEAKANGVDVTLRLVDPEETGAEHCQHDNPTIGQELLADWLADVFRIDQRALLRTRLHPLI